MQIDYSFKKNKIYCGDNLEILKGFPDECIDLIYIDPPFFSGRNYEIIFGDQQEVRAFEDIWSTGIESYKEFMEGRIRELYRVLTPTGSFYLHCDYHANAHLRIMCDRIFGENNFKNEIIWWYKRWSNASKNFQRMHDTILFYVKGKGHTFNVQYQPYSQPDVIETTVRTKVDGKLVRMKDKNGNYIQRKKKNKGVAYHDVFDIQHIQPTSKERLGYPTQKPEKLLELIVKASSNEGDLILDAFCGCGTTIAVAKNLKREFIGIDFSHTACMVVAKRIHYRVQDIIGLPRTMTELKKMKPFEFQNWVIRAIGGRTNPKKVADGGIDGWKKKIPIEVKQHSVGRPDVQKFITAIKQDKKKSGIMIGLSFSKGAKETKAWVKNEEKINIEFITAQAILDSDERVKEIQNKGTIKQFMDK